MPKPKEAIIILSMSTAPAPTTARRRSLLQSLWFWVVLAFLLLIGAWTTIIMIATKNRPANVELEQVEHTEQTTSSEAP
ncbi:MAG: hypothetical protein ACQKBW_01495 [Puniceicoccales bacterium]